MAHDEKHEHDEHHHHYIMPTRVGLTIGAILLVLTAITVWVAHIDMGKMNLIVAMLVATVKALLVCMFFMNLKHDDPLNGFTFSTSFLFLAIFVFLTGTDMFFRGDVYHRDPIAAAGVKVKAKFKKPWVATAEMLEHGKKVFETNCVSCHGAHGAGDGQAATSLNPKPRNFTQNSGWKNGRKVTKIYKTLNQGLGGMPSFASFGEDDKWAVDHYVISLGSGPAEKDTTADFAEIQVDPTKEGAESSGPKVIPIEMAMDRVVKEGR
jgi:caa(3)-type oxidase subunit IV